MMKLLISFALIILTGFSVTAQDITGIWRGYFMSGTGFYRQRYKYEIQIEQLPNSALNGVTYSYRTTVFYGKAAMRGIYMSKAQNVILQETKMLDVKIADQSIPCIMTCYLDYSKNGDQEVLEGNFTSVNVNNKADCGAGTVYLEKVPESDFQKEDFLVKREKSKQPPKAKLQSKPAAPKTTPQAPPVVRSKPKTQPKPETTIPPATRKTDSTDVVVKTPPSEVPKNIPQPKQLPIPDVIKERENALVKTITTTSPDIKIQLYDNGEIDDDTITVYHNNEIIAFKKRLSYEPITLNIKASLDDSMHEFIMVADNLGRIPPNTALMVITTGGKRYELFITSTEQKNAKVIIKYKIEGKDI
ncbi:hypothetical protein QTN47_21560 [Danxiaibacter flavus]|uniref:Uncharacterized protein n=1 Tax=Danxiaibacter flavus TaxID=3049108 RepID=A0ABV3ZJR1_9BACT|nr:hypothetical protein QNM32_21565 [Chitinophagaceae bacterium DXS]